MNEIPTADRGVDPGRDAALAERFVTMADTLAADFDIVDVLDGLVNACVELADVDEASLLLGGPRGELRLMAAVSETTTHHSPLFEAQVDEGPGVDAARTGAPVSVPDLAAVADRWPLFVGAARSEGFGSAHALPLRLREENIGALTLLRHREGTLDDDERRIAQALADVATIGVLQQRGVHRSSLLAEQLQQALSSRVGIEQAKGVLPERGGLGMPEAFSTLRSYARRHHLRISDAAERVVLRSLPAEEVLGTHEA